MIVAVLVWMVFASLPRGPEKEREASWEIAPPLPTRVVEAPPAASKPAEPAAAPRAPEPEPAKPAPAPVAAAEPKAAPELKTPVAAAPVDAPTPKATVAAAAPAPAPAAPPVAAPAPEAAPKRKSPTLAGSKVVCEKAGEPARELFIAREHGRYELVYVKPGGPEAVAWSQSSARRCQEIQARISRKLTAAGYSCDVRTVAGNG